MLNKIPKELQVLDQWVNATTSKVDRYDKLPINPANGKMGDPVRSATWTSFKVAKEARTKAVPHMGFVLTSDDPYTIIDLDNPDNPKKNWDEEHRAMLRKLNTKVMATFESYTEMSQSGTGVHIIIKGSIPKGVNRDTVELYSSERYMITTGRVIKDLPIVDCQEALDILYHQMKPISSSVELIEMEMTIDDAEVVELAMNASNGEKFTELCNSTPDGILNSEMDLALLSIIAFYTESNEQCRRIFRMTSRGKRTKVVKNDKYLDYTLQKIRANAGPKINFDNLKHNMAKMLEANKPSIDFSGLLATADKVAKGEEIEEEEPVVKTKPATDDHKQIDFPPGLVGRVAEYIYDAAARPVREIALMGAIGFIAGFVGRQYNISSVGLNQYLILLAKTGTGKEGIASGCERLTSDLRKHIPMVVNFVGPSAFASGPALVKTMSDKCCFLSILGEFGLTLQQLCDPHANGAQVTLRQAYLDLYQKSGKNSVLNSSVYSDREKNTDIVQSPALTILGESTPESFYEGLSEHHISDGLIPRFTMLEYTGPRPYLNDNLGCAPKEMLIEDLVELLQVVLDMQMNQSNVDVQMTKQVKELARQFEIDTTDRINNSTNLVLRQLWSRADLKIKKLAGLIAVGMDIHNPIVKLATYNWAKDFVVRDIEAIMTRFKKGNIGHGEGKQYHDLMRKITAYFKNKPSNEYKAYHKAGVIPMKYLRRSLNNISSFKKDKRGVGNAIKCTLKDCCESGELIMISPAEAGKKFNTTSLLYGLGEITEE